MSYIKNKLDELIDTYRKETGFTEYDVRMVAKKLVAEYRNHIVEMIVKDVDMTDQQLRDILYLLQDNPASQDKE